MKSASTPTPRPAADAVPNPEKDPRLAARSAHLRYVADDQPGIRREGDAAAGFRYYAPSGEAITDNATLQRIKSLVIPPAYSGVWISPLADGHLQATGRDERGRKQYRYHPEWRSVRDGSKFHRMIDFGEALPAIRRRVEHDLARPGLPREKVLATVVRLLESTLIRVGSEEYAKANDSFGLTTMQMRHVDVEGSKVHFSFRGKSGKHHEIDMRDRRLAQIVARCKELHGSEVFEYLDHDGHAHAIHSEDVNGYIHETAGQEFTAKDFRTWAGTVLACACLCACDECDVPKRIKHDIVQAVRDTSARLGNTPAVCRKSYIHPGVLSAYEEGTLRAAIGALPAQGAAASATELSAQEAAVLRFLKAEQEARHGTAKPNAPR